jgi:hypothetical protein
MDVAGYLGQDVGATGQEASTNATGRLISLLNAGKDAATAKFEIERLYGPAAANAAFSNANVKSLLQKLNLTLPPIGKGSSPEDSIWDEPPKAPPSGSSNANYQPGVPVEKYILPGVPLESQREYTLAQVGLAAKSLDEQKEALGTAKTNGVKLLSEVRAAVPVVADPDIKNLFAIGKGPNIVDLIIGVSENRPLGDILARAGKQAQIPDQKTLTKLTNAYQALQNVQSRLATNFQNQTNLRTEIESVISSGKINDATQETVVRALMKIGSDAALQTEMLPGFYEFIGKRGNDARDWAKSEEKKRLEIAAAQRGSAIASAPIMNADGSFKKPKYFSLLDVADTGSSESKGSLADQVRKKLQGQR